MWGSVAEYYSNNSKKWYLPCSSRWNQRLFLGIRGDHPEKKLARRWLPPGQVKSKTIPCYLSATKV